MLRLFIISIMSLASSMLSFGDVLLWQVNDATTVDSASIQLFLAPYPSSDDSWPAARVKLVSSDGASSTILRIGFGDGYWEDGYWGVELSDPGGGYWGAGAPTGVQSETGYNTIGTIQGQLHGETTSYPAELMEASFVMELGYNVWDEDAGDYVWKTIAQSNPELYRDLVDRYMYASGDIAPNDLDVWTPDFYTMPEPSTAMLALVGTMSLLLRRRKLHELRC